jgi:hypothetical protein
MAVIDQYRTEQYPSPTDTPYTGGGGGSRRSGRAKLYSDARAGISRTGGVVTPGKTIRIPFGGGGGGGRNVGYAQEDYERQMALMDKIAEMSAGYSTAGTLGTTDVDYEGKMITQKLSPELQAQYDALLARSGLSQQQVAAMGADPYEMQQYLYEQNLALKQPAQEDLRTQTMEALQAKGMFGSTGGAGLYGSVEEAIQRSNAQDFNDALMQSQGLLDMERARGSQDLSQATAMGGLQIPFMESGRLHGQGTAIGNVEGVSGASANIANQLASRDYGKRKGLWDMMGGGAAGGGGGLFSKIVCTAMNDDYGFGAYRNAIWLKYSELNYKDKPEMEKGYHAIFKPLLNIRKKWYGKSIYALMKHIAKHRTVDLRAEMYGKKRDRVGQAWRFILEPICYLVGKRLMRK